MNLGREVPTIHSRDLRLPPTQLLMPSRNFAGEYYTGPFKFLPQSHDLFHYHIYQCGGPSRQLTMSLLSIPFEGQAAIHLPYFQLHIYLCYFQYKLTKEGDPCLGTFWRPLAGLSEVCATTPKPPTPGEFWVVRQAAPG
jgi:hypothetical protein